MNPITGEELSRLTKEEKRALLKRLLLEKTAAIREYPLSCGQQALWFVHKLRPDSAANNVAFTARLRRPLDVPAFERALLRLTQRHAALRTTFVETDGDPVQRVSNANQRGAFRQVEGHDSGDRLQSPGASRPSTAVRHRADALPSDALSRLGRVAGSANHTVHHLVFDAGSAQILFDDLRGFYEREAGIATGDLPPLPAQYSDFVAWQRDLISSPQADELSNYWAGVLATPLPALQFAGVDRQHSTPSAQNGSIPLAFDRPLIAGLREIARARNSTLSVMMLAAFQVLLHRYTGQDDVLIGCPSSGRNQARWLGVIGYFINMLPVRSELRGNPAFANHLACTREALLGALAHQDYPFPLMVERLRLRHENPASPLVQVMFNLVTSRRGSDAARLFLEDEDSSGVPFGGTIMEPYPIPQQEAQFGLVFEAIESDGMVKANLKYSNGGPDRDVALAMAEDFCSLLAGIVISPESRVRDLALPHLDGDETTRDVIVL